MTFTELVLKTIGKFPVLRRPFQSVCRSVVRSDKTRRYLNNFYNRLNSKEKISFHFLSAKIFRNKTVSSINGSWIIFFNKKKIQLPLRKENLWLDWDLAVSILGHDVEIKSFYEKIINSTRRPSWFFDIGANYGTHSLLFLSQGINTVTFEPNPECKATFEALLNSNNLKGQLENCALGETNSTADLVFPKSDTWNGTLEINNQQQLVNSQNLQRIRVDIISLDHYVGTHGIKPDMIKIDTEGFELNVLKGARNTLSKHQPIIIFESNDSRNRADLFKELLNNGYNIYDLNEKIFKDAVQLKEGEFVGSQRTNFVAMANSTPLPRMNLDYQTN